MRKEMIVWALVAIRAILPAAEKPQVLAFGSSDACEWCNVLKQRVFASAAWREWAAGHVEFVRVDLPRGDGVLAPDVRGEVVSKLRAIGFSYVSLDLEGYRTGSLNENLSK